MAAQPEILQACLKDTAAAASSVLETSIEDAVSALQIAESLVGDSGREQLNTAWRQLLGFKSAWSTHYPNALLETFTTYAAAAARGDPRMGISESVVPAPKPVAASRLDIDSLTLVNDADVSEAIASARLLQLILPSVEHNLADLNKLVSSLQGLPRVTPQLNPLRPEAFAHTLYGFISAAGVDAAVSALWVRQIGDPLGRGIDRLYESLVNRLEMANVEGARYKLQQAAAATGVKRTLFAGDAEYSKAVSEAVAARTYADLADFEFSGELFQDFLSNRGGNRASQGLTPSYYKTVDEELAALQAEPDSAPVPLEEPRQGEAAYEDIPVVDRPQEAVGDESRLSPEVWGALSRPKARALVRAQLKKDATRVEQVLGIEVIRKLVSHVAQDPRLLKPVREAIVALEPSLLRLALADPRFFSDEGHPGRRLMERVAQRSFKFNDEYSGEFQQFFGAVADVFTALNDQEIADAAPFGLALQTLESGWSVQDEREDSAREAMVRKLQFAEQRQVQADAISADLAMRSDLGGVPDLVLNFLLGPWSLAMAHARMIDTRNQVDPMGFGSVVPDLLWSVKREVTLKQPAKLFEMLPGLLGKLHAGLELLGQDPRESEVFFDGLMKLHRPVLKLRRVKTLRDAEESGAMPLEPFEPTARSQDFDRARGDHDPMWMDRSEMDAAGFEDTLAAVSGDVTFLNDDEDDATRVQAAPAQPLADQGSGGHEEARDDAPPDAAAGADAITREGAAELLMSLKAGHWVDLFSRQQWLRAQLIWASSRGTLFMFVSHGGQAHSMTKRSCERLIVQRLLRPVDTQGVVAQALDAVASEAAASVQSAQRSR